MYTNNKRRNANKNIKKLMSREKSKRKLSKKPNFSLKKTKKEPAAAKASWAFSNLNDCMFLGG